jgi:hypothetical protein
MRRPRQLDRLAISLAISLYLNIWTFDFDSGPGAIRRIVDPSAQLDISLHQNVATDDERFRNRSYMCLVS